jgi:exportin-1
LQACDTFLKISQKCRRKFVTLQTAERVPFIEEIIQTLPEIIAELENSQIQTFYEALGCIVSAQTDPQIRGALLASMMSMPNQSWSDIMQQAAQNIDYLKQPDTTKSIETILKTNVRACFSLGANFVPQLSRIYLDMLNVYKVYSGMISSAIVANGAHVTSSSIIRSMRAVKKQVLKLIETFVEKSESPQSVCANFIPPLLESVLGDYKSNVPDARDPEVLSLIAMIINRMQGTMTKDVGRIFEHTFQCTLEMITKNFSDYPEHRIHFFTLLRAVNNHCFQGIFLENSLFF